MSLSFSALTHWYLFETFRDIEEICLKKIAWKSLIATKFLQFNIELIKHISSLNILAMKTFGLSNWRLPEPSISEVNPEWQKRIGKAGRRMQWSQALYIDIEDLIAERNNFRVAIGTTWTVLGKRLTLPVFRLLRMYVLSHGGFRYAFAECKMRARRRNSTYYGTIPSWGRKGGEEMGMRQGTIIVAAMRSFFFCLA